MLEEQALFPLKLSLKKAMLLPKPRIWIKTNIYYRSYISFLRHVWKSKFIQLQTTYLTKLRISESQKIIQNYPPCYW